MGRERKVPDEKEQQGEVDVTAIARGVFNKTDVSLFYHYEPWDGEPADEKHPVPKWTAGGAKFQKSMHKSLKTIRAAIAANRIGKTLGAGVDAVCAISGELPYAMRYEEGVDTKIKRALRSQHDELGKNNIRRWGRWDTATGELIDHNEDAPEDGTWDCKTIIGVGSYPKERICKTVGQQV